MKLWQRIRRLSAAARITLIYITIGCLWIYFSDSWLLQTHASAQALSLMQSYKGWFYVFASALLLYLLIHRFTADIQRSHQRTAQAYEASLHSLLQAIELRDTDTQGHSQRVVEIALRLAKAMGFSEEQIKTLRQGALLHDIGKIGVPDHILRKPGKLTQAEWRQMRGHAQRGYELLRSTDHLKEAAVIALCHHERWDGSGYPRALRGESIPIEARVFAIADVWDALTSSRPYRSAWDEERAQKYILRNSGKLFDPQVVEVFKDLRAAQQL